MRKRTHIKEKEKWQSELLVAQATHTQAQLVHETVHQAHKLVQV